MTTQRPTDEVPEPLAVPETLPAMQARVKEALATGLLSTDSFASNLSPAQQLVVAKVALEQAGLIVPVRDESGRMCDVPRELAPGVGGNARLTLSLIVLREPPTKAPAFDGVE